MTGIKFYRHLRYLAEKTRRAVEMLASDEEEDFEEHFNCPDTLSGYCARASAMLSAELTKRGIGHRLVYSDWGHVHIDCHGYIMDVTATQFGNLPKVMVRRRETLEFICKPKEINTSWWKKSRTFKTMYQLRRWQNKERWPYEQTVNEYDLEYMKL